MNCALLILLSFDYHGHDASCPYLCHYPLSLEGRGQGEGEVFLSLENKRKRKNQEQFVGAQ